MSESNGLTDWANAYDQLVDSLSREQMIRMFEGSCDALGALSYAGPLDANQIGLMLDIIENETPFLLRGDPSTIAYRLLSRQRPSPEQVLRLVEWVDDPDTWSIACDRYPGGETRLVEDCNPHIAVRYANRISPTLLAEWRKQATRDGNRWFERHVVTRPEYDAALEARA